jgi:hypothetical protein
MQLYIHPRRRVCQGCDVARTRHRRPRACRKTRTRSSAPSWQKARPELRRAYGYPQRCGARRRGTDPSSDHRPYCAGASSSRDGSTTCPNPARVGAQSERSHPPWRGGSAQSSLSDLTAVEKPVRYPIRQHTAVRGLIRQGAGIVPERGPRNTVATLRTARGRAATASLSKTAKRISPWCGVDAFPSPGYARTPVRNWTAQL